MRKSIHVLAGAALFGAALLLPGAAPAESSRQLDLGGVSGGSCPAAPAPSDSRAQMMARLEAKLRAEMGGAGDVQVLNGRGYRYENDRVPGIAQELSILELELQRARAAAKAQQQAPAQ
jgi:hypothetical protein